MLRGIVSNISRIICVLGWYSRSIFGRKNGLFGENPEQKSRSDEQVAVMIRTIGGSSINYWLLRMNQHKIKIGFYLAINRTKIRIVNSLNFFLFNSMLMLRAAADNLSTLLKHISCPCIPVTYRMALMFPQKGLVYFLTN